MGLEPELYLGFIHCIHLDLPRVSRLEYITLDVSKKRISWSSKFHFKYGGRSFLNGPNEGWTGFTVSHVLTLRYSRKEGKIRRKSAAKKVYPSSETLEGL